jgi:hypothetical protein
MWPIKLCPNAASVVIEDHLCAPFTYNHAFPAKLAIVLVKANMSDVRNLPAGGRRQISVEIQEFIGAYFGVGEKVLVNANAVLIADHSVYSAVPRYGQAHLSRQFRSCHHFRHVGG